MHVMYNDYRESESKKRKKTALCRNKHILEAWDSSLGLRRFSASVLALWKELIRCAFRTAKR